MATNPMRKAQKFSADHYVKSLTNRASAAKPARNPDAKSVSNMYSQYGQMMRDAGMSNQAKYADGTPVTATKVKFAPSQPAPQAQAQAPLSGWRGPAVAPPGPQGQYSTVLPSLTAEDLLYFADARRRATAGLERARNAATEGNAEAALWAADADGRVRRSGYNAGVDLRHSLSADGLGFSPMFVNRGMRDIASSVAGERASIEGQKTARASALERSVQDAMLAREEQHARITREEQMLRSGRLPNLFGI